MNFYFKNKKGFTLIELLVVVAIIGLLASVVVKSLSTARLKARDAAIKLSLLEYKNLLEITHNTATGYDPALLKGWNQDNTCTVGFSWGTGGLTGQAASICSNMVKNGLNSAGVVHFGSPSNWSGNFSDYSIMAYLPGKQTYFCLSSTGKVSDTDTNSWTSPGCWGNI